MKAIIFFILSLAVVFFLFISNFVLAEDKSVSGGIIPKLPKTANDPELFNGHVYPAWGPVCQRYTYSVVYRDKEGRKPEYVKIYFNGKMIDLDLASPKASLGREDYQKSVRYEYKFVPNKLGSNFYYFEASNGLGKARASIIDSPDNGPVLFKSSFVKNQIVVVEKQTGKIILNYPTAKEWVSGIALSDDGKYLAAKTSKHIYLFDTTQPKKPLWEFNCEQCRIGDDVKGGIDISADGKKIIAAFGERIALFDKSNKQPVWMYDKAGNSYNVAISKDGKYMAAATSGDESNLNSNLLILWSDKSQKPLWQYHSSGNFHDVSLSDDGKFITGSTGCPDRRFYVFDRDSNRPLIKSDTLTRDSPVHRAKISADGRLAAVGSESDAGAVFLFKTNSKKPIWKFPTINGSSVRALNFTPDGKYIGAATFGGQAYIFENSANQPIASWTVKNTALGGIDIADDGSFIAVGGTDNKLHIFDRDKKTEKEIIFNEYLEEIDISANGKYIAAGTGGSVYFFETFDKETQIALCATVIEPKSEAEEMAAAGISLNGKQIASSLCGDYKCEGPETIDNCETDCGSNHQGNGVFIKISPFKFPGMLAGFGFLTAVLTLGIYFIIVRFNLLGRNLENRLRLNKKLISAVIIAGVLFLVLTLVFMFLNKIKVKKPPAPFNNTNQGSKSQKTTAPESQQNFNQNNINKTQGICGNDICEPGLGETKQSCPQDCSAED